MILNREFLVSMNWWKLGNVIIVNNFLFTMSKMMVRCTYWEWMVLPLRDQLVQPFLLVLFSLSHVLSIRVRREEERVQHRRESLVTNQYYSSGYGSRKAPDYGICSARIAPCMDCRTARCVSSHTGGWVIFDLSKRAEVDLWTLISYFRHPSSGAPSKYARTASVCHIGGGRLLMSSISVELWMMIWIFDFAESRKLYRRVGQCCKDQRSFLSQAASEERKHYEQRRRKDGRDSARERGEGFHWYTIRIE